MVPMLESGGETVIESGAIVHSIAENCETLMPPGRRAKHSPGCSSRSTIEPRLTPLADGLQHNKKNG